MDEDQRIETHPELMNPDWQKYAEREAWLGAKQDRRKLRGRAGSRGHRRWRGFVVFLVVLAGTTAAIVIVGRTSHEDAAATPTTVNPTVVPDVARVDLGHPYANTPADVWKKGIDGITAPAPAAVGAFKADAVADAYAKVRQAISTARLDPSMLYQHDPKAYLASFATDAQNSMRPIIAGDDASGYVTRVADGYHLLDAGPRTLGTMSAHPGEKPGELAIEVHYVVAYAFDDTHPRELTGPSDFVSFLRVDDNFVIRSGKTFAKTSFGLWPAPGGGSFYEAIGCDALKKGFLAPGYSNPPRPGLPGGSQQPPGAYDPKLPMPQEDNCSR